jgi:hypothetical protein
MIPHWLTLIIGVDNNPICPAAPKPSAASSSLAYQLALHVLLLTSSEQRQLENWQPIQPSA